MPRRPAYRLQVETLEDRLAPVVIPTFTLLPPPPSQEIEPNEERSGECDYVERVLSAVHHKHRTAKRVFLDAILSVYPPRFFDLTYSGSIAGNLNATTADVDYFLIATNAQTRITIIFSGDAVTSNSIVQLLDADGNVLAIGERTAVSLLPNVDAIPQATLSFYSAKGGTFYIRIGTAPSATSPGVGAYTLGVVAASESFVEHEPNDTPEQANPIVMRPNLYPLVVFARPYGYPWYLDVRSGFINGIPVTRLRQ